MRIRAFATVFAGAAFCSLASAQWTAVSLQGAQGTATWGQSGFGGQQVGDTYFGPPFGACLWNGNANSWVNLHPAGAQISRAFGTNGTHQVGYVSLSTGRTYAALWSGEAESWVNLAPDVNYSAAYGIDGDTQVGVRQVGETDHAFIWRGTPESGIDLNPAGSPRSYAHGIGGGKQVGEASFQGRSRAALWSGSAASFVNLHPAGAVESYAKATDGPTQVGYAMYGNYLHAGYWKGSAASWVDLHPANAGLGPSLGYGVYRQFQVGTVRIGTENHAYIWQGSAESGFDLNTALPAGYGDAQAVGIWSDGVTMFVIGQARNTVLNRLEAILWSQPDPDNFTFSLNKSQIAGQNYVMGTIEAAGPLLSSREFTVWDNSSLVATAPTVSLAANATQRSFQISTTAVNGSVIATIYVSRLGLTRSGQLTLQPLIPTAMAFTPSLVSGGQPTSCRLVINGIAGPGGKTVAILDDSAAAAVPSSVMVPPGANQVTFPIQTSAVTTRTTVTVTARVSAGEKAARFRIDP